jgi:serine protease DegQ
MFSKVMVTLLALIVIGDGIAGYCVYSQNQTINSLNKQLTASEEANAAQITAVKNNADSQLTALTGELTSDQASYSAGITGLQNQAAQVAGDNLTFGKELDTDSARITTLSGEIDTGFSAISNQIKNFTPGVAADKVYSKVSPSIVQITDGTDTYGAGFIFDTAGHVITAAHVIDGLKNISVILSDGTVSPATVVGSALRSDVAVLKLSVTTSLPPVTMAGDNSETVGEAVMAYGHPYDLVNSLSSGVISQIHRFVNIDSSTNEHWLADLIQFDAATNPGNSGGPLFDQNGNVVGMVVAGIVPIYGSGINFAVSSARIDDAAGNLIKTGTSFYPYIGVYAAGMTQSAAASLGLTNVSGAIVINLDPPSPATTSGIKIGDIITAINSVKINCAEDLYSYFGGLTSYGNNITVQITRGSQTMSFTIRVAGIQENYWWQSIIPWGGSSKVPWPGT